MIDSPLLSAPWRSGPPSRPVAWRVEAGSAATLTLGELHERIGAWQALLDTLAAPRRRWLLHHLEPFEFAAALIALWERGDSAVLPADDRPETLAALDTQVAARLGDVVGGQRPVSEAGAPRWGTLEAERIAVSLYTSGSSAICRYPETLSAWLKCLAEARRHDAGSPRGAVLISAPPPLEHLPTELDWRVAPNLLARIHSSGAPLSQAASEHARAVLGVAVSEIYGSSETGGIAWREQQRGKLWAPLPGIAVRADAQDCLWLRSPYLPDTEAWERQADRIALEGDGFRLLGRADRIIKVGGKRLSLTGMDRALEAHPRRRAGQHIAAAAPRHPPWRHRSA